MQKKNTIKCIHKNISKQKLQLEALSVKNAKNLYMYMISQTKEHNFVIYYVKNDGSSIPIKTINQNRKEKQIIILFCSYILYVKFHKNHIKKQK